MSRIFKVSHFVSIFLPIILIITGMVLAGSAIQKLVASSETLQCFCPSCPATALTEKGAASLGLIKVDIQGAVKKPGIYQLELGQRIADLVASASGFTKDADPAYLAKNLNLATELKDQDKIYIPFLEERQSTEKNSSVSTEGTEQSAEGYNLISINQADAKALQTLSGIGEVKAQAIIDNRPYSNLDDLVDKKIISENLLNNLRSQLSL